MKRIKLTTFNLFKNKESTVGLHAVEGEELKKIQSILLETLDDVIAVCKDNNISFAICGGSALGAVRHKGFIPWDDDIDINMSRREYERLIPLLKEKYKDKYWIHTPTDTHNYALLMAKIRRKGTCFKTRDDFQNDECGVPLDIFIVENTYDNIILRTIHGIMCMMAGYMLSCRKFYRDRKELKCFFPNVGFAYKVKVAIGFLLSPISIDSITRFAERVDSMCKNDGSKFVSTPAGRLYFFGELFARSDVCKTKKAIFENREVDIPLGVEKYFARAYGDWVTIPKESEIEKHMIFGWCYNV